MKWYRLYIVTAWLAIGCSQKTLEKPQWLNATSSITIGQDSLYFKVPEANWNASISTPVQLIYPDLVQNEDELVVIIKPIGGIIEGMAFLTLESEENQFIYSFQLKNPQKTTLLTDLRTPKTLSTDSSLVQQQILYQFDDVGNLIPLVGESYFEEKYIELLPETGTFQSETGTPQSSFYVEAGTVVEIPLSYSLDGPNHQIRIQAGPLMDRFDNKIADGTHILFFFQRGDQHIKIESVTEDAFATLTVPREMVANSKLVASIAQVSSQTLNLLPND